MIAICPAGPPKLMKPSLSQKRKASQKLTAGGADSGRRSRRGDGASVLVSCRAPVRTPASSPSKTPLATSTSWSSSAIASRMPASTRSTPGASGGCTPPASSPCTSTPSRSSAGVSRPKLASSVSNVTLRADVAEGRAVEVEADRLLRAVGRRLQPDEARLRVDEAADQPGAGQTVDPGPAPRGPGATAVVGDVQPRDGALRRMRFVGRKGLREIGLELAQRGVGLALRFAREEVDRNALIERLAQLARLFQRLGRRIGVERRATGGDVGQQGAEIVTAVEQGPMVATVHAHHVCVTALLAHVDSDAGQQLPVRVTVGQQIHAVAQHGSTTGLERAPGAHACRGVLGRQRQDQQMPMHDVDHTTCCSVLNLICGAPRWPSRLRHPGRRECHAARACRMGASGSFGCEQTMSAPQARITTVASWPAGSIKRPGIPPMT